IRATQGERRTRFMGRLLPNKIDLWNNGREPARNITFYKKCKELAAMPTQTPPNGGSAAAARRMHIRSWPDLRGVKPSLNETGRIYS
ncbi:MAG TPA: hypothetical protein VM555_10060, partial [Tahibacter sp.]|nr:hypothetical protein [Tahibacter sp.]